MLTRAQVSRRLGKSLATVRRLEGTVLHPRRDSNGVHRFDAAEVERVAEKYRSPERRRLAPWTQRLLRSVVAQAKPTRAVARPADEDHDTDHGEPEEELADSELHPDDALELAGITDRVQRLEGLTQRREAEEVVVSLVHERQCIQATREIIELAASLSDSQLKELGPVALDLLESALRQWS